jgi:putative hydrolase of the HAD superfamily
VVGAVIFDFYGTLARWADGDASYGEVFAAHGYELSPAVFDGYFARYDGVEHHEHSVSQEAYEAWVRTRLRALTDGCGIEGPEAAALIDALRSLDQGTMVAYPEAAATLESLRAAGVAVGVCSNWGWELDGFLDQTGLLHLVDVGLTSARVGVRKPHPAIYARSLALLGVDPRHALFVGDSWEPDVRGPRRAGMGAVHVWRVEERAARQPPDLEPGDHRVEDLRGVLGLAGVDDGGSTA